MIEVYDYSEKNLGSLIRVEVSCPDCSWKVEATGTNGEDKVSDIISAGVDELLGKHHSAA